jgi:penicillin amidase
LSGAAFPGLPGVVIGRNDHISWGVTNTGADIQDLFVIEEIDATSYAFNATARAFTTRVETIKVKVGSSLPHYSRST